LGGLAAREKENQVPLLRLLLEKNDLLKVRGTSEAMAQTDDGFGTLSLEQKMREIDNTYGSQSATDKVNQ